MSGSYQLRISLEALRLAETVVQQRTTTANRQDVLRDALELGLLALVALSPADAEGHYAGYSSVWMVERLRPTVAALLDFIAQHGSPMPIPLPAASAPRPEPPPPETIAVAADDDLMAVFGGLD